MNNITAALACFVVTLVAIALLRPLAIKINLVDRPGGRKTHHGEVPIIGGLGMFFGIVVGMGLLQQPVSAAPPLLAAITLMVLLGLADDRFSLSPWTRLPVQITAAAIAAYGTDTFITTLGDPFGFGEILLSGAVSKFATIFLMVATINAFNMLDGMDGLAGMAAAIGFAALGYTAAQIGLPNSPRIALIVIAAVLAFLVFNAPLVRNNKIRCFMGDAGSTFLGLAMAWICLRVSQGAGERSVSPVTAMWLVALPMFELVWSSVRRLLRGQSPLQADAEHFHHLMIRAGLSVRAAFIMFALLSIALAMIGIAVEEAHVPEPVSFLLLMLTGFTIVVSMYRLHWIIRFVPIKLRRDVPPAAQPKPKEEELASPDAELA
ncbi:MAG: hypothetical protein QM808_13300 [Steroidobacteraceae bacterium]